MILESKITRLTLGDEKDDGLDKKKEAADQGENVAEGEKEVGTWTEEKTEEWLQRKASRVQAVKTADKRKEDNLVGKSSLPKQESRQAKRRRQFDLIGEDWGEERLVVVEGVEPYLPLPQRIGGRQRGRRLTTKEDDRPAIQQENI